MKNIFGLKSWFNNKSQQTKKGTELDLISSILFPKLELERDRNGVLFHLDYSVDSNLQAVLSDFEDGIMDLQSQQILSDVIKRLDKVRKILKASQKISKEASCIIVDIMPSDEMENIKVAKD